MSRFKCSQRVKVEVNPKDFEKVFKFLCDTFSEYGWDSFDEGIIEGNCEVTGWYEPEVRYTKNGDGNPASWELDDGLDDDYLEDEIEEKIGVKVKANCELESQCGWEEYDY